MFLLRTSLRIAIGVLGFLALAGQAQAQTDRIELPELGDGSSGYVSPAVERRLGDAWLRMFRSRVPTVGDPLIADYIEHLVYRLAVASPLQEAPLSLVVVSNKSINAFAVPGGVIGIHDGLLLSAHHEDELSSVIAHEIAHLSQRHFARGVEQQARSRVPTMLAMLSSLVLIATVGGDAGMAALTATQAASLQSRLSFSRQNEQEADRIGFQTLVAAGMDPQGMPRMFERMLDGSRLAGNRPPEFLLSHPVTESRVADARGRAAKYPSPPDVDELEFQLMRARVQLSYEENAARAVQRFDADLEAGRGDAEANRYGLALAHLDNRDIDSARNEISKLLARRPNQIAYVILAAELDSAARHYQAARRRLEGQLRLAPGNHPLTMSLAKTMQGQGEYSAAAELLAAHAEARPQDPYVWYELAEVYGLSGDILGVHKARSEFFMLTGALDLAQRQLGYALKMVRGDFHESARIQAKLVEIDQMREELTQ